MGLTVERDGTLTLAAPPNCPTERLIKFAKSKTFWVYTQIAKRDLLRRPHAAAVEGEPEFGISKDGFLVAVPIAHK